jgi:hypothetical protein
MKAVPRKEFSMSSIAPALIRKLENLPQQRLAEVEDFVEFLAIRENRAGAGERLGNALSKLDALNLPPLTDADIAAEIAAGRQERTARRT